MRKQRKEDLEKHVAEVNMLLKKASGDFGDEEHDSDDDDDDDEEEFTGFDDAAALEEDVDREAEYVDEDKYTDRKSTRLNSSHWE